MKTVLSEYYISNEQESREYWGKATIVLDTNVLLDLYRNSAAARDTIIEALEKIKDKLWLPYQVAYEYHENRKDRTKEAECNALRAIKDLESSIRVKLDKLIESPFYDKNEIRNKYIDLFKPEIEELENKIKEFKSKGDLYTQNDIILEKITSLYESKVGENFSENELIEIFKEGERRYSYKVPPGYEDKNKIPADIPIDDIKNNQRKYGDLLIWKQIIKYANDNKTDIIFVSNDIKPDWRDKETKEPRKELYKEFFQNTKQRIDIKTFKEFQPIIDKYYTDPIIKNVVHKEVNNIDETNTLIRDYDALMDNLQIHSRPLASSYLSEFNNPEENLAKITGINHHNEILSTAAFLGSKGYSNIDSIAAAMKPNTSGIYFEDKDSLLLDNAAKIWENIGQCNNNNIGLNLGYKPNTAGSYLGNIDNIALTNRTNFLENTGYLNKNSLNLGYKPNNAGNYLGNIDNIALTNRTNFLENTGYLNKNSLDLGYKPNSTENLFGDKGYSIAAATKLNNPIDYLLNKDKLESSALTKSWASTLSNINQNAYWKPELGSVSGKFMVQDFLVNKDKIYSPLINSALEKKEPNK